MAQELSNTSGSFIFPQPLSINENESKQISYTLQTVKGGALVNNDMCLTVTNNGSSNNYKFDNNQCNNPDFKIKDVVNFVDSSKVYGDFVINDTPNCVSLSVDSNGNFSSALLKDKDGSSNYYCRNVAPNDGSYMKYISQIATPSYTPLDNQTAYVPLDPPAVNTLDIPNKIYIPQFGKKQINYYVSLIGGVEATANNSYGITNPTPLCLIYQNVPDSDGNDNIYADNYQCDSSNGFIPGFGFMDYSVSGVQTFNLSETKSGNVTINNKPHCLNISYMDNGSFTSRLTEGKCPESFGNVKNKSRQRKSEEHFESNKNLKCKHKY